MQPFPGLPGKPPANRIRIAGVIWTASAAVPPLDPDGFSPGPTELRWTHFDLRIDSLAQTAKIRPPVLVVSFIASWLLAGFHGQRGRALIFAALRFGLGRRRPDEAKWLSARPICASGHCPRNAAFMRQSDVEDRPCRMNSAFRSAAAPNLGAVSGCSHGGCTLNSVEPAGDRGHF
jgi:hypothetical protein